MSKFTSGDNSDNDLNGGDFFPKPAPPPSFFAKRSGQASDENNNIPVPMGAPINPLELIGEHCLFKSGVSAFAGGVFGTLIGTFMASTAAHNITHTETAWQQFKGGFKGSLTMGRNFGFVGFIYAGTECYFEQARAKSDKWNTMGAGCFSGGVLAAKGGTPQSMFMGCAGFAAFSAAIDYFTGRHDTSMSAKYDPQKF